jgi:hypothetical protein
MYAWSPFSRQPAAVRSHIQASVPCALPDSVPITCPPPTRTRLSPLPLILRASLVPHFHPAQDLRIAATAAPATTLAAAQVKCSESFGTLRTLGRGKYKGLQKVVPPSAACPRRGWQPAVVYANVSSHPLSVAEAVELVRDPETVMGRCRPKQVRMALQLGLVGGAVCGALAWLVASVVVVDRRTPPVPGGDSPLSDTAGAGCVLVAPPGPLPPATAAAEPRQLVGGHVAHPPSSLALMAGAAAAVSGPVAVASRHAVVGCVAGCAATAVVGLWSDCQDLQLWFMRPGGILEAARLGQRK